MTGLARIEDAVAAIGRGEIVVVVDDEDRENEGDLIMAAEFATPENDRLLPAAHVRRHLRHRHVRAGPRAGPDADGPAEHREPAHRVPRHRRLPPRHDDGHLGGRPGGHDPRPRRPGHQARRPAAPGPHLPARGPRGRRAQAGRAHRGGRSTWPAWPAARRSACCARSSARASHDMARRPELEAFCADHGLLMISIADLIRHRRRTEKLVRRVGTAPLPTTWGEFEFVAFESVLDGSRHLAFVRGDVAGRRRPARARAQRVPHRRRVRVGLLPVRAHARRGDAAHRRRGHRRARVPARPRGPRPRRRPHARRRRRASTRRSTRRRRPTAASTASGPRSSPTSASRGCA